MSTHFLHNGNKALKQDRPPVPSPPVPKADIRTQDAVVRNLEIIGEASGRLPDAVRQEASEIEWRKIVGIRNILAHGYFDISLPIIWDVVQNKLDELFDACSRLVSESGD
jgi:uncharacterized protein with HEPN domain